MAYIGQGIKEGTFSVLDTSGNTYNGSNVTFSLGTQVGSPAQLLVSHDGVIQKPGTDYSLATGGTQITFSTAPASGASIFIVEISGAVGGPLDSDLNGTELILDADGDTSITADTDDQIDVKIAGADDFSFTANTFTAASGSTIAAQALTATTLTATGATSLNGGAFVFNEDSADVDFRIESNGNANAITVDGGNDTVGLLSASTTQGADVQIGFHDTATTATAMGTAHANDATLLIGGLNSGATQGSLYLGGQNVSGNGVCGAVYGFSGGSQNAGMEFLEGASGDAYGQISFKIANGTAGTIAEALLIQNGLCKTPRFIIDNDVASGFKLNIEAGGNNESGIIINDKDAASGFTFNAFRRSGTEIGSISRNGSNDAVLYTTSSDYRLKDGIVDKTDGITKLKQLKPKKFYWKSDSDKTLVDGFVAHEVSGIVPESISGTKDATETLQKVVVSASGNVVRTNIEKADWTHGKTEEGGEIYASNTTWEATKEVIKPQGIDQSKLVPLLTSALQEAITKIETLETKVTALEG